MNMWTLSVSMIIVFYFGNLVYSDELLDKILSQLKRELPLRSVQLLPNRPFLTGLDSASLPLPKLPFPSKKFSLEIPRKDASLDYSPIDRTVEEVMRKSGIVKHDSLLERGNNNLQSSSGNLGKEKQQNDVIVRLDREKQAISILLSMVREHPKFAAMFVAANDLLRCWEELSDSKKLKLDHQTTMNFNSMIYLTMEKLKREIEKPNLTPPDNDVFFTNGWKYYNDKCRALHLEK